MRKIVSVYLVFMFMFVLVSSSLAAPIEKQRAYVNSLQKKLDAAVAQKDWARAKKIKPLLEDAKATLGSAQAKVLRLSGDASEPGPSKNFDQENVSVAAPDGDMQDLKEEINQALAELKGEITKVKDDSGKSASVSGRAYISYTNDLKDNGAPSAFDISRVYLDVKKKLDRGADARFTTDIARESLLKDTSGKTATYYYVYLKYAYFGLNNIPLSEFLPLGVPYSLTLRVGQSATHWIDYMQNYWTFRYVAKTMTDHYKLFTSADLGVAALGSLDLALLGVPGLGQINYHATFMNGSGYKEAEGNPEKNFAIRLDSVPYSYNSGKVTVGLGAYAQDVSINGGDNDGLFKSLNLMAAWDFSFPGNGRLFTEYARATKIEGLSAGGQYEFLPDWVVFGRIDSYDKDMSKSGDTYGLNIYGVEYKWGKNIRLALDYQNETQKGADKTKILALHSEVKW
ncbi:MAG: hypothetical protein ABIJ26_08430 [Candidatus Margulisiibacteriota bacterium]|nr:porin [Candidatus Margulisiibacteriota bacterium]